MTTAERTALSRQVKRVRQDREMTQAELAEAANVSRQTLSDIENGSRVPQDAVLRRIMGVLGIDLPGSDQSDDTRMWLGLIGGVLEAMPPENRPRAGKAALDAATAELLSSVSGGSKDREPKQDDFRRAAHSRSEDRGEDHDSI
ncbi:hypothetical protein GCM10010915_12190 [Microbacterium faecale]|uniref:HTH cro/C1-type domain-containing protein n=2 Tax=Microbacterium faecale TaxID=1804630 RepID=A0A916Y7M8_9MICO|nr:hypothetical protein GCM10010915_12190 [Microbacterium faecale]